MINVVINVVLAEDNPGDVFLVRRALDAQRIPYTLHLAKDGEEALKVLEQAEAGERLIDLILIDLNLPRHDGIEVLTRLRKSSRLANLPVVLLTSSDSPRDRERCLTLGANRYFQKPTDLKRFMEVGNIVAELLESHSSSPATD